MKTKGQKPSGKSKNTKIKFSKKKSIAPLDLTNASVGSFYARTARNGESFTLYRKRFLNNFPVHERIDESRYQNFSLNIHMTFLEAKARVSEINKSNKQKKIEITKRDRAFVRYQEHLTGNQEYFPADSVKLFEDKMEAEHFGSLKHLEKKLTIFSTAKEILNALKITPDRYFENSKLIYKKFMNAGYSVNYCQKLISVMNDWGRFFCSRGSGFYKVIPSPKGVIRAEIDRSAKNKTAGVRKEAIPLTEELLNQIISNNRTSLTFSDKEINFFKATFFLGLRPDELMKSVNGGNNYSRITDLKSGLEVVRIEQEKLSGLSSDKRTKLIAIKWQEQQSAVEIIETKNFSKPSYEKITKMAKAIKCNTKLKSFGLYSGRKGFTNWCFDKGETDCFAISSWLGHSSPEMTFKVYRDRQRLLSGNMELNIKTAL